MTPAQRLRLLEVLVGPSSNVHNVLFLGENSRTADQAALARAKEMAGRGMDRDRIWLETGWAKGRDGKWFYEIDDRTFARADAPGGEDMSYSDIFSHPELEQAYDLRDARVSHWPFKGASEGMQGMFGMSTKPLYGPWPLPDPNNRVRVRVGTDPLPTYPNLSINSVLSPEEELVTALHETQHMADALSNRQPKEDWDSDYHSRSNEVRARNVEQRRTWTPEQRRATPPWATEDVPENMQDRRATSRRR